MDLFAGKALSQLTFEELRQELTSKEVAEGFYVDYKVDFPEKLHKYVASFANYQRQAESVAGLAG